MCLKFCVIITFAHEFWLKCFQLQSYNCPWNLSNDRWQAYIKMNMRWLCCKKNQNICFICFPKELGPFLGKNSLFLGEIAFSPWGTIMSLGRKNLSCLGEQLKSFFSQGNNHVLGKKEFKLPWGTTLKKIPYKKIMSLGRRGLNCPKEELIFFFLKEQSCPQREWT